jgi:hypothetical protein
MVIAPVLAVKARSITLPLISNAWELGKSLFTLGGRPISSNFWNPSCKVIETSIFNIQLFETTSTRLLLG